MRRTGNNMTPYFETDYKPDGFWLYYLAGMSLRPELRAIRVLRG
jgi:hypothetical protein